MKLSYTIAIAFSLVFQTARAFAQIDCGQNVSSGASYQWLTLGDQDASGFFGQYCAGFDGQFGKCRSPAIVGEIQSADDGRSSASVLVDGKTVETLEFSVNAANGRCKIDFKGIWIAGSFEVIAKSQTGDLVLGLPSNTTAAASEPALVMKKVK